MIYSHKPQRSGRSIVSNTNNPPQDPPPPNDLQIPDVLIEDSTPPVPEYIPEVSIPEKKIIPKKSVTPTITPTITPTTVTPIKKISWFTRIISKIRKIFSWSKK